MKQACRRSSPRISPGPCGRRSPASTSTWLSCRIPTSIRSRSPSISLIPEPMTSWIPALANGGAIVPIDDYVTKYMNKADLDDYHPLYKSITLYKGKRWGVFDDGDQFALYYRKDIFDDAKLNSAYQAKFGKSLALPTTW